MNNEFLLIINLLVVFSGVLLFYKFFGNNGLFAFTVFSTIIANIEVLILIDAFGMEQTLGNIIFASTFLVTDILSEKAGKKVAQQAVNIGIATSIMFIVLSQFWLLYTPNGHDWAYPAIKTIFSNTPRTMLASLLVYAISQKFDVWAYHQVWSLTTKITHDSQKFLWLRNNGATLIAQFLNTVLFNLAAFGSMYDWNTLWSIIWAGYAVFVVTSLADTPFIYLARRLKVHDKLN